ncbi:MAG: hypothetical protein KC609_21165, partial [Myxococcales bacterium]|nr:hypothetical protein [Myxococcales bacterium]
MPHKSLLITLSTALLVLTMGSAFAAPKRSGRLFVAEPQVFGVVGRSTVDALTRSIVQQARQTRFRVVVEAQLRAQQRRFRGQFRQCRKTTGQCSVWAARLARATLMVRSEIIRLSESLYQVRFAFMDPTWRIDALRTDFVVFGGEAEVLRQARIGIVNLFEGKQGVDLLDRYQQSYGLYARVRVGDLKLAYGLWRA